MDIKRLDRTLFPDVFMGDFLTDEFSELDSGIIEDIEAYEIEVPSDDVDVVEESIDFEDDYDEYEHEEYEHADETEEE